MVLLHPHPRRVTFSVAAGVGHAGGGELHLERHLVDRPSTVTRTAVEHEQLVLVQRGTGVVHNGYEEAFPVASGDVVVVPAHTCVAIEVDSSAELLVFRRTCDEASSGPAPSDWFG